MLNVDYVYIDALRAFTRASYRKVKLYFTSKLIEHNKLIPLTNSRSVRNELFTARIYGPCASFLGPKSEGKKGGP